MIGQEISAGVVQNEVAGSAEKIAAIPQKSRKVLDGQTELYRHFDAGGELLYVGISLNTTYRLMHHKAVASWFDQIARIEIERFATRDEARDAELVAIRDERPIHNRSGRPHKSELQLDFENAMAAMTAEDWAYLRQ